jgi:hypothetical protein
MILPFIGNAIGTEFHQSQLKISHFHIEFTYISAINTSDLVIDAIIKIFYYLIVALYFIRHFISLKNLEKLMILYFSLCKLVFTVWICKLIRHIL